jgi:hypothetical protein
MPKPVRECVGRLDLEHSTIVSVWIRRVNLAVRLACGLTPELSDAHASAMTAHFIVHGCAPASC